MDAGFYRAFEDRYRGSREDILQRLQVYQPFTLPLVQEAPEHVEPKALDIGCGRGEWLQLMQQQGYGVHGVDLDAGMLESCRQLGLPVTHGDGLAYMAQQAPNSLQVVSAFHVVEHIPFEAVVQLAQNALQALVPGGVLIFETPNPENMVVASRDFYLDPSHIRPIPPKLLAFALEYVGFARVKVLRLNENAYMREPEANLSLWDVLSGVSPDYAVVAQKAGGQSELLDSAFSQEYGVDLDTLAVRYQQRAQYHLDSVLNQSKTLNQQQQQQLAQHQADLARLRSDFLQYQEDQKNRLWKQYIKPPLRFIKHKLLGSNRFIELQVRRVREKGLRACLRRLPYKLGWWRISQKFGATTSTVVRREVEGPAVTTKSQAIHPKQWAQRGTRADEVSSPLEQWNRQE